VVLMDVQMPVMDGLTATRRIRRTRLAQQPFIIALTADVGENARQRCLAAGMDDYISKPIAVADLVRSLHRSQEQEDGKPASEPETEKIAPPAATNHLFDAEALRRIQQMLGEQAVNMLPTLIADFHRDSERLLGEIETAVTQNNLSALKRAAHSLKSNSAHFGLMHLSEQARQLEMNARESGQAQIPELVAQTRAAYEQSGPFLADYLRQEQAT
jgi:CheY-like chemotaxis protein